jgi:alkylhydroperoxidase family enzyme
MSRLDPLPPEHTPELKEQFDSFFKSLGFVPNSVLTMQRNPKLVRAFVVLQGAVWGPDSEVDRGLKRLIGHVASRSAGDVYSMAHTASGALHFGISAEKPALAVAAAAGKAPNAVTDAMFAELRRHWSEKEVVEIVAAIAATGFVNRWNATMATPLEDEPMQVGEAHLARHGWSPGRHRR